MREYEELRKAILQLKEEHPDIAISRFEYKTKRYNDAIRLAIRSYERLGISVAYASEKLKEAFPLVLHVDANA